MEPEELEDEARAGEAEAEAAGHELRDLGVGVEVVGRAPGRPEAGPVVEAEEEDERERASHGQPGRAPAAAPQGQGHDRGRRDHDAVVDRDRGRGACPATAHEAGVAAGA